MQCLRPVYLTVESGGREYKSVPVPCGKCEACLSNRARDWQVRLKEELKVSSSACFVTLTYNDQYLPREDRDIVDTLTGEQLTFKNVAVHRVRDVQNFIKRLRWHNPDSRLRYFMVSEYGPQTFRPHYHGIIFNLSRDRQTKEYISSKWKCGFVTVSTVTPGRIAYVTKYCFGSTSVPYWLPPNFTKMSLKPPIGLSWYQTYLKKLERYNEEDIRYFSDSWRLPVPSFYRRKLRKEIEESILVNFGEEALKAFKRDRMEDYLDSHYYSTLQARIEADLRDKEYIETGQWHETPTESKIRVFLDNFYEKYNKTRKKSGV